MIVSLNCFLFIQSPNLVNHNWPMPIYMNQIRFTFPNRICSNLLQMMCPCLAFRIPDTMLHFARYLPIGLGFAMLYCKFYRMFSYFQGYFQCEIIIVKVKYQTSMWDAILPVEEKPQKWCRWYGGCGPPGQCIILMSHPRGWRQLLGAGAGAV